LPVDKGLLIEQVSRDGAAAHAGLHGGDKSVYAGLHRLIIGGDLIVAVDGKDVARQLDLDVILNHEKPGNTVRVTIYRGGKKMDVNVTLGEQPQSGQR
jgi:S1-C subfamily serine protease